MARGRKPDGDVLSLVKGGARRPPQRQPAPAPVESLPKPPKHFSRAQRKLWRTLCTELIEAEVLATLDLHELEHYCEAWHDYVECSDIIAERGRFATTEQGYEYIAPWTVLRDRSLTKMMKIASNFGMNPTARRGAVKASAKQDNSSPFDRFANDG